VKIIAKKIMQKLWEKHYDWDFKLDEEDEIFLSRNEKVWIN
jgi:hypothetical protein